MIRLNLGSGPVATPGWVCIDRSPNIALSRFPRLKKALLQLGLLVAGNAADWDSKIVRDDIRKLTYADGSVDAIYSSHALEHIYLDEARQVLAESWRVLRPGGILRLALPDAYAMCRQLVDGVDSDDAASGERYNEALIAFPPHRPKGIALARRLIGGHVHRWQPTFPHVAQLLQQSGFAKITRCEYLQGELPGLNEIETRPESFFVEARK